MRPRCKEHSEAAAILQAALPGSEPHCTMENTVLPYAYILEGQLSIPFFSFFKPNIPYYLYFITFVFIIMSDSYGSL
jgi:hypothetical protein